VVCGVVWLSCWGVEHLQILSTYFASQQVAGHTHASTAPTVTAPRCAFTEIQTPYLLEPGQHQRRDLDGEPRHAVGVERLDCGVVLERCDVEAPGVGVCVRGLGCV